MFQYIHIIFRPDDAIYFVKCTSPSNSKAPPKRYVATPVLLGWFTVDIDTFVPGSSSIFTRSFVFVLGLICTVHTKVCSSLGDRTRLLPEWYEGCLIPWCLYLHTIVCIDERGTFKSLEIAPKDELDVWRSTSLGWFLLIFKQRGTEFEGRPWNTSTGTPPNDSNDVN